MSIFSPEVVALSQCMEALLAANEPSLPDWISALSSLFGALVVIPLGLYQIYLQVKQSWEQEQRQATLAVCQRYESAELQVAMGEIWNGAANGTDYRALANTEGQSQAARFLNYLQGIAIGIEEGIYLELMVRKYLDSVVRKAVHALILGVSENGYVGARLFPEGDFDSLCRLYRRWNP